MLDISILENWFYDSFGDNKYKFVRPPYDNIGWKHDVWSSILKHPDTSVSEVSKYWKECGFTNAALVIENKLHWVGVLYDNHNSSYLVAYYFQINDGIYVFAGGVADSEKQSILPKKIDEVITPIVSLHDGFLDLSDGQSGWFPRVHLETKITKNKGQTSTLLEIFQIGTNCAALEYGQKRDLKHLMIWAGDEEIEEVDNLIVEIDEWLADQWEEFDDAEEGGLMIDF